MGRFGGPSPKRHNFIGNDKYMLDCLQIRAGYMSREAQRLCPTRTAVAYVDKNGVNRRVGKKNVLKDSQHLGAQQCNANDRN